MQNSNGPSQSQGEPVWHATGLVRADIILLSEGGISSAFGYRKMFAFAVFPSPNNKRTTRWGKLKHITLFLFVKEIFKVSWSKTCRPQVSVITR